MNVKAQALLNATKWIEEQYGQPALRDVLRACTPEVRERYTSAIAINWLPLSELVSFLEVAEATLGRGDGRLAEEIGAAGGRSNMRGTVLRIAFYLAKPEFMVRRVTHLWRQFNDQGSMALTHIEALAATFEIKDIPDPNWLFCCTITGWARELVHTLGGINPIVKHVSCRGRGQARCVWELRWSGKSTVEMSERSARRQ